jgi:hypothetical protein
VGIHPRAQIVPRLRLRYLHCRDHVKHGFLVQQHLSELQTTTIRLCCNPFLHWQMAIRWLHHLLLPLGAPQPYYSRMIKLNTSWKLAYEGRKAKRIIASRDISYAFTNVMANNYYSLRTGISCLFGFVLTRHFLGSYDHFCFFDHIQQSTKKSDDFAFFVFFTFKSTHPHKPFANIPHFTPRLEASFLRRWSSSSHQRLDLVRHILGEKK